MITGIEKAAGALSEFLQGLNPLNVIGAPVGTPAAATTPTKTEKEMEEQARSGASNILVPGVGAYHHAKRLGHVAAKASPAGYASTAMDIAGGVPATVALQYAIQNSGMPNRSKLHASLGLNFGTPAAAALAAFLTKRRTPEEQTGLDKSVLNNILKLIPGVGTYNFLKRLGSTVPIDERAAKQDLEERDSRVKFERALRGKGVSGMLGRHAAGVLSVGQGR